MHSILHRRVIVMACKCIKEHADSEFDRNITQTCLFNILRYFTTVKMKIFQVKNCDIFLIFAQNIDCGYTLEPPQ